MSRRIRKIKASKAEYKRNLKKNKIWGKRKDDGTYEEVRKDVEYYTPYSMIFGQDNYIEPSSSTWTIIRGTSNNTYTEVTLPIQTTTEGYSYGEWVTTST